MHNETHFPHNVAFAPYKYVSETFLKTFLQVFLMGQNEVLSNKKFREVLNLAGLTGRDLDGP